MATSAARNRFIRLLMVWPAARWQVAWLWTPCAHFGESPTAAAGRRETAERPPAPAAHDVWLSGLRLREAGAPIESGLRRDQADRAGASFRRRRWLFGPAPRLPRPGRGSDKGAGQAD